ncbi:hypothetical protein MTP99_015776 [Tenebrio molitor]|nr:hypothetical protein MTP99_015776 [Tenebrio molitor]
MESPVKKFFTLNLFVMRLLGFYPSRRFKQPYRLYSFAVYIFFTIPVPTLAAIHLLADKDVDLTQVYDSSLFQLGCFIFKLVPFVFNVDNVRESIYMLEWPIFNNYTTEQEKIIEKCVKTCKRNTWLFLGFCVVAFLTWAAKPFFQHGRGFPIEIWLPSNINVDTRNYVLIFLFIFFGIGDGAIANGAIDPLVSGLACYATMQLKVLKDNLQHLREHAEEEFYATCQNNIDLSGQEEVINKIIYNRIVKCIDHHVAIFNFIQYYEKIYSSVVFTQFTAAVVVVCISCLQLTRIEPFTFTFFAMISFLLTMLLEIFLYCYFGATLYEESNSLTTAIYMGRWYDYDLKSKKALIVLMERSKRPMIVTAGKILDLSLVTFTTILRRAYSLLAVLKNY